MGQLEAILLGGVIAMVSSIMTRLVYGWLAHRSFVTKAEFKLYEERYKHYENRLVEVEKDIHKMTKMFEKFIIHSDLDSNTKAKILNGS